MNDGTTVRRASPHLALVPIPVGSPPAVDVLSLRDGEARISYPRSLTPEDCEDIQSWLDLMKRKVARLSQSTSPAA